MKKKNICLNIKCQKDLPTNRSRYCSNQCRMVDYKSYSEPEINLCFMKLKASPVARLI
jgi:hypothetical protein